MVWPVSSSLGERITLFSTSPIDSARKRTWAISDFDNEFSVLGVLELSFIKPSASPFPVNGNVVKLTKFHFKLN